MIFCASSSLKLPVIAKQHEMAWSALKRYLNTVGSGRGYSRWYRCIGAPHVSTQCTKLMWVFVSIFSRCFRSPFAGILGPMQQSWHATKNRAPMRFPCCLGPHRSVYSALFLFILLGVLAALAVLVFGWASFRTKWLALVPGVVAVNVQHAMQSTASCL